MTMSQRLIATVYHNMEATFIKSCVLDLRRTSCLESEMEGWQEKVT